MFSLGKIQNLFAVRSCIFEGSRKRSLQSGAWTLVNRFANMNTRSLETFENLSLRLFL